MKSPDWCDTKKTRFSHLKSSAFEFYLNAKQKRFGRILTMTFSISIFLIVTDVRAVIAAQ